LEDTLVCLTASIGLPLGEHGVIGYSRPWLHEELVHLPLLMRLPRCELAGWRLDALTQPVDLVPTFLEFLEVVAPPSHGHSLWPLLRNEVDQVRPFACSGMSSGNAVEWALRTQNWAFLLPLTAPSSEPERQAQLYVKPDDRWEVNDVRQHHLDLMEEMEKKLRDFCHPEASPSSKRLSVPPPRCNDSVPN
jgi:arylsulfatase A-like enzyme